MMRNVVCLLVVLFSGLAQGQDPTVPSKDIVARLKVEQRTVDAVKSDPAPNFKLRAIVLATSDQGIAILEAEGRRFRISLDRNSIAQRKSTEPTGSQLGAVQVRGTRYYVEDFSARTIALSDGVTTFLVQ